MTDRSLPDDEILSSYLDGEATPDEVARVARDPGLRARLDELRAASDLIATPVERLPAETADRLIASALDASATSDAVTDLGTEALRRHQRRQRLVAVAAGVLVVGIAVPLLFAINGAVNGDDKTDSVTAAVDTADEAADMAEEGAAFDLMGDGDAELPAAAEMMPADESDATSGGTADAEEQSADDVTDDAAPADEIPRAATGIQGYFVLPGALGPYPDEEALIDDLTAIWAERVPVDDEQFLSPTTTTTSIAALPCGQEFLEYFDGLGGGHVLVDLTVVEIGSNMVTLGLGTIDGVDGVVALADQSDCVVREVTQLVG